MKTRPITISDLSAAIIAALAAGYLLADTPASSTEPPRLTR